LAIEEYSPDGAQYCTNPVIKGNTISAPSASNSNGTGISAVCVGATIQNNTITDAIEWAIEATGVGTTITGNSFLDSEQRSRPVVDRDRHQHFAEHQSQPGDGLAKHHHWRGDRDPDVR
jgi:hypothetical protein